MKKHLHPFWFWLGFNNAVYFLMLFTYHPD